MLPIQITPSAQEVILQIKTKKNITNEYALRIGIKGDGCAKDTPFMGFDTPRPTDKIFENVFFKENTTGNQTDINIIIHPTQMMYLFGWILDYKNENDEKGFYFYKEN